MLISKIVIGFINVFLIWFFINCRIENVATHICDCKPLSNVILSWQDIVADWGNSGHNAMVLCSIIIVLWHIVCKLYESCFLTSFSVAYVWWHFYSFPFYHSPIGNVIIMYGALYTDTYINRTSMEYTLRWSSSETENSLQWERT